MAKYTLCSSSSSEEGEIKNPKHIKPKSFIYEEPKQIKNSAQESKIMDKMKENKKSRNHPNEDNSQIKNTNEQNDLNKIKENTIQLNMPLKNSSFYNSKNINDDFYIKNNSYNKVIKKHEDKPKRINRRNSKNIDFTNKQELNASCENKKESTEVAFENNDSAYKLFNNIYEAYKKEENAGKNDTEMGKSEVVISDDLNEKKDDKSDINANNFILKEDAGIESDIIYSQPVSNQKGIKSDLLKSKNSLKTESNENKLVGTDFKTKTKTRDNSIFDNELNRKNLDPTPSTKRHKKENKIEKVSNSNTKMNNNNITPLSKVFNKFSYTRYLYYKGVYIGRNKLPSLDDIPFPQPSSINKDFVKKYLIKKQPLYNINVFFGNFYKKYIQNFINEKKNVLKNITLDKKNNQDLDDKSAILEYPSKISCSEAISKLSINEKEEILNIPNLIESDDNIKSDHSKKEGNLKKQNLEDKKIKNDLKNIFIIDQITNNLLQKNLNFKYKNAEQKYKRHIIDSEKIIGKIKDYFDKTGYMTSNLTIIISKDSIFHFMTNPDFVTFFKVEKNEFFKKIIILEETVSKNYNFKVCNELLIDYYLSSVDNNEWRVIRKGNLVYAVFSTALFKENDTVKRIYKNIDVKQNVDILIEQDTVRFMDARGYKKIDFKELDKLQDIFFGLHVIEDRECLSLDKFMEKYLFNNLDISYDNFIDELESFHRTNI